MAIHALTSAEISLPERPDAARVRERIAALADQVDLVGLTDNHAGLPRMSPLAAVALAREQGVSTVVHVSCRDRNRLALRSQIVGASALGSEGILCLYGDPVEGVPRVRDMTTTRLLTEAKKWAAPHPLAVGAVVNPFADDVDHELALLGRKLDAGADFIQSQMVFDLGRLRSFVDRAAEMLAGVRFYASIGLLRSQRMADRARKLPGNLLPDGAYRRISAGGGVDLAAELAAAVAELPEVDALHVIPLGAETEVPVVAAAFRNARGLPSRRELLAAAMGKPSAGYLP
jgi:methylenetetrahydrofolate reductase (NADPH)